MKYQLPILQKETSKEVHASQRQFHVSPVNADLHVITMVYNPSRYYTRYKLYQAFEQHVLNSGGVLWTVEVALRDRHFEVTDANNPYHLQLRTTDHLWLKENALNILARRLPADWEYVAWIDADILFARPDWVVETIHKLQEYKLIQMFTHAIDLNNYYQPQTIFNSFIYSYRKNRPWPILVNSKEEDRYYHMGGHQWHPGYAWAARRSAFNDLGGLGEIAILGSADHHMACALVNKVEESINGQTTQNFKDYWYRWQERANKFINGDIGYMNGTILHYWHGQKADRRYVDRWKILVDNNYDPVEDIYRDAQGLLQLNKNKPALRDQIKDYFSHRNEDYILNEPE
jgi:hypothetical protein